MPGIFNSTGAQILDWVARHSLVLQRSWAGEEIRSVYVSSNSGECFQIWFDPPSNGHTCVHVGYVDGQREYDLAWMKPSERYLPSRHPRESGGPGATD